MNKEEILKMSREENEGRRDEYEMMAYGTASRVGMLVGAIICAVLVFASELLFHIPEIGVVCLACILCNARQWQYCVIPKIKEPPKFDLGHY